ncbi:MAG: acyltransferase [Dehalococcoidia bacterium]|nr:acyltransferase [Dehalococcoidia bacterium]
MTEMIGLPAGPDADANTAVHYRAIDGLRAVAVLLVVFYHAGIRGFDQGYLGVDMFLGISGFLITTRLTSVADVGRLTPLREYWAARARRIIPAVTLIIVVTCIVSAVVLAYQELSRVGFYGLASDLFVMNIVTAVRGGNYFAGSLRDSPFLHMWSLGVEEQFYLLLPLLLGPVMLLARGIFRSLRPAWQLTWPG